MRWIELTIRTTSEASDALCEKLIVLGADGVTVEDPNEIAAILNAPDSLSYADEGYVEGLGGITTVKAYFAELEDGIRLGVKSEENQDFESTDILYRSAKTRSCSPEELFALARAAVEEVGRFLPAGDGTLNWRYVADEDWANGWKKYYRPLQISDRVVICPSWENYAPNEGEVVISLDPGSAFGTGTHATTAMCAQLLDRELSVRVGEKTRVLDLGCGSGILSIIAAKLGAAQVDAVDIDPVAVGVASENCRINGAEKVVRCKKGELRELAGETYPIILANIIADVIAAIAADVPAHLAPGGVFITSGIIGTKREKVLDACAAAGLERIAEMEKDDWVAFVFGKKVE